MIIAGAGGAAHLPGHGRRRHARCRSSACPVPLDRLDGLDSLLSIVQMPAGVPVATVSIGGGRNAGLLAVRILAASDDALRAAVARFQADLAESGGGPRRRPPGAARCRGLRARCGGPTIVPVGNNAGLYALTEEHEAIREAVRDIAEREIAPFAAEVDAESRYPGRGAEGADRGRASTPPTSPRPTAARAPTRSRPAS